jgi:hypothetical protein
VNRLGTPNYLFSLEVRKLPFGWHKHCTVEINGRRLYVRVEGRVSGQPNNAAGCNS